MWKKTIACLLAAALCCCGFAPAVAQETQPLSIVCTIFPIYDWVRQIIGDSADVNLTLLMDDGVDLHNFQPTVADMAVMQSADLLLYVGGESDAWVEDVLAQNPSLHAVALLAHADAKAEELVEGMEHDHDHDHEEEHDHDEDHDHDQELDEHVWLSLKRAQTLVGVLAQELSALRPEAAEQWTENAEAYCAQLRALDEAYQAAVSETENKTLLFADRFPFRYLAEDYGLTYFAAFSGCSAETEASFETMMFLVNKLKELQLPAVLTIEGSDGALAQTVISSAGSDAKILQMNSCQSVTRAQMDAGENYLSLMQGNLTVLKEALQ